MDIERPDFVTVSNFAQGVVVFKELIYNSFYFGKVSDGVERTDL